MFNIPMYYDYQNVLDSVVMPSTIHVHDTALARYFKRYLVQQAISVFKWNLPKNWDKDYFLYVLYLYGFISVINTDKFGVICQHCTLTGYGVYYQPTEVVIANPLFKGNSKRATLGVNAELIKLQLDYGSIIDLVNYYGDLMALSAESAGVNLLNSKLSYIFAAGNKAAAESFKKLYDKVSSGEGVAVYDKALLDEDGKLNLQMFNQNLKNTYIAGDILSDLRKYKDEFLTIIGINNANTDKKERMITDEVNANNQETHCLADLWLEQLKECCTKVNDMFDIGISVDWRYKESEVISNESDGIFTRSL